MGQESSTDGAGTSPAEKAIAAEQDRLPYKAPKLVRIGSVFELTMKSGTDFDAITNNLKSNA